MIKGVKCQIFEFPICPVPKITANPDGTTIQEKIDEMDIYVLKKDYKLVHSKIAEFIKKEKRVFPIITDQCSPSLRSQLEGAKTFEET